MAFQLRRGLDAERTAGGGIVFAEGELVYITDTEEVYVGDGVTPGGIRVTGNVETSPATLTQNLSLGGFDINGTGNININGTISASNITGGGGGGLIEGQEYAIDIVGDVKAADSAVIVDSSAGIVYADFVGDGSLISNITLDQLADVDTTTTAPTNGQSLIWDGTNFVPGAAGSSFDQDLNTTDTVNFARLGAEQTDDRAILTLKHTTAGDISSGSEFLGTIFFTREDANGTATPTFIVGGNDGIYMAANATGTHVEADYASLTTTGLAIGAFTPNEKLDVRGNVAIANGSIRFTDSRAIADIATPQEGEIKFEPNEDSLALYNSAGWQKVVLTDLTTGLTSFNAGARLGANTQAEIDQFLEDSTAATGAIAYNDDVDRFEFFQAGSWVRLPNAGGTIGEVLKWDGAEWSSAPDTGGVEVGSNADFLDGFDGTYYLDWNNFTNKPTLFDGTFASLTGTPTTIAGYGITDAFDGAFSSLTGTPTTLVGYGITDAVAATDLGNFTFTNSILDSSDSSGITITPAVTISSDLTVENDLTVTNKITVDTLEVTNLVTAAGAGTPEITSDTDILLTAGTRVEVSSSPFKLASFTTVERDALSAENGDMIYNTTDNKFQGYENGAWANLI